MVPEHMRPCVSFFVPRSIGILPSQQAHSTSHTSSPPPFSCFTSQTQICLELSFLLGLPQCRSLFVCCPAPASLSPSLALGFFLPSQLPPFRGLNSRLIQRLAEKLCRCCKHVMCVHVYVLLCMYVMCVHMCVMYVHVYVMCVHVCVMCVHVYVCPYVCSASFCSLDCTGEDPWRVPPGRVYTSALLLQHVERAPGVAWRDLG